MASRMTLFNLTKRVDVLYSQYITSVWKPRALQVDIRAMDVLFAAIVLQVTIKSVKSKCSKISICQNLDVNSIVLNGYMF